MTFAMIYFDNAATTFPKPKIVMDSVNSAISNYGGNPGRGGHKFVMRVSEKIYGVRKSVAEFFNPTDPQPQNVVFTCNCTMALNLAIKGVLKDGDHAIISHLEHNSVIRPVYKLSTLNDITYDIADVYENNSEKTIASFKSLIKKKTKAIICTHASNVSGHIMPIKEIGKLCKENNIIFIVDAAQTAGVLPIDMKNMNIDILCTAGHKGLYGITGTGILILNKDILLNTLFEGGTGSLSVELDQPDFYPDRLESGTANTAGIFSIGAGIDFIKSVGIENIYTHELNLCNYLYNNLIQMDNIRLYLNRCALYKNVPVISFNINGIASDVVIEALDKMGFALRGGLHCSPLAHEHYGTLDMGMVRFAPSVFTKKSSVESFVKVLRDISKKNPI